MATASVQRADRDLDTHFGANLGADAKLVVDAYQSIGAEVRCTRASPLLWPSVSTAEECG